MEQKWDISKVKVLTEEEKKLQRCHYPTPDIHRCANAEPCGFNDPSTDNYLIECTCCEGYCDAGDDGEECRCEQILRLMD